MSELINIPVDQVLPNPEQPRMEFDAAELSSLAESIREHGLIQPIVVERQNGNYILIDGERRLRAVKLLGKAMIEAKVRSNEHDEGDSESNKFVQAVVANLQRSDLNPIEEGLAYRKLYSQGWTQAQIGGIAGRSQSHINLRVKMLDFEPEIQSLFAKRKLPIDQNVVYKLFSLPAELRVKMAVRYAARGFTATGISHSITCILNSCEKQDVDLSKSSRAPVMMMGDENKKDMKILSFLEKDGALPEWRLIDQAAKETCEACDLHDIASATMCRDCPAVDMLKRLNRMVSELETK